jgi:YHS domain-containing protein
VPRAPVDPGLFAVHDGRIYAFATEDCVREFAADPTRFVKP